MLQAKEVYEMLKLNKDRIKYFKKQGIFKSEYPGAGYSERDVARLKKIVVLTKMGLTCGDIKKIDDGKISFQSCIEQRRTKMEAEIKQLKGSLNLSAELLTANVQYDSLPSDYYLKEIKKRENEGEEFVEFDNWEFQLDMLEEVICPNCGFEDLVDLEDYIICDSSDESENGMGPDLVRYFDTEQNYECPNCDKIIRISGWKREYPIGAFDSEDVDITLLEDEEDV